MKACKKRKKAKYRRGQVVFIKKAILFVYAKITSVEFHKEGYWYWFKHTEVLIPERKLRALTKTEKEGGKR